MWVGDGSFGDKCRYATPLEYDYKYFNICFACFNLFHLKMIWNRLLRNRRNKITATTTVTIRIVKTMVSLWEMGRAIIFCSFVRLYGTIHRLKTHETCRVFVMANLLLGCMLFDSNFVLCAQLSKDQSKEWKKIRAKTNLKPNHVRWIPLQVALWKTSHNNVSPCGMLHDLCQIWMWRWLLWMKPGTVCE